MMKRSQEDLRKVGDEFVRRASEKPNLGMVLLVFDSRSPRQERPVGIVLHGIPPDQAVRMLRQQADTIEKAEGLDSRIVLPNGPLIVKA